MASQIAHIIYCQKYFDRVKSGNFENLPDHATRKYLLDHVDEFMLGSIFPDIRRIDEKIKRKDTHLCFPAVDLNFEGLSAFEAGWKFHLYCDMKREEILRQHDFLSIQGAGDFYGQAAKELEDKLIYDQYNNWEKLVHLFNNVVQNGNPLNVSHETLGLWYAIIAQYIKEKPNEKSIHIFLSKQKSWVASADAIIESLKKLEENKKAVEILEKIYKEII